jgi:hypothetical protein
MLQKIRFVFFFCQLLSTIFFNIWHTRWKLFTILHKKKLWQKLCTPWCFWNIFLFTPLKCLSSFHTTMRISHYKLFSIYIVIVCKYWYSVNVMGLLFNWNELTPGDHRYKFFLLYYVKLTRKRKTFPFIYKLTN